MGMRTPRGYRTSPLHAKDDVQTQLMPPSRFARHHPVGRKDRRTGHDGSYGYLDMPTVGDSSTMPGYAEVHIARTEDRAGNLGSGRASHGPQGEPAGFADWLRRRRLAPEHRLPHFERWVVRFLRLARARPRESWQDTLRVFLEDLGQAGIPDWQIRQAADAVSLYCGQFRPQSTAAAASRRPAGYRALSRSLPPAGRPDNQRRPTRPNRSVGGIEAPASPAALLSAHRAHICRVGATLLPLPRDHRVRSAGHGNGQGLHQLPGHARKGGGVDPEPGVQRSALSAPPHPTGRSRRHGRHDPRSPRAEAPGHPIGR